MCRGCDGAACAVQPNDSRVMFHGLRIRMGGHTARVTHFAADPATGQLQYRGSLLQTARAVSDACAGGQIVFTQATISAVHSMTHLTSSKYGDVVLLHEGRHYLTAPPPEELEAGAALRTGGSGGAGVTPLGRAASSDAPPIPGHFQRMLAEELAEEQERRVQAEAAEADRQMLLGPVAGMDGSSVMWLSGYSGPVGEGCAGNAGGSAWSVVAGSEGDEDWASVDVHGLHEYERLHAGDRAAAPDLSANELQVRTLGSDLCGDVGPVAEGMDGVDEEEAGVLPHQVRWVQGGPAYDQLCQVSPERPAPSAAAASQGSEAAVRPRGQSQSFEFPTGVHAVAAVSDDTVRLAQPLADLPESPAALRPESGLAAGLPRRGSSAAGVATLDVAGLRSSGASSSLTSQARGRGSWGSLAGTEGGTPSGAFPQLHVTCQGGNGRSPNIFQEIRGIRDQYLRAQLQNYRQGSGQLLQHTPLSLSEDFLQRVCCSPLSSMPCLCAVEVLPIYRLRALHATAASVTSTVSVLCASRCML